MEKWGPAGELGMRRGPREFPNHGEAGALFLPLSNSIREGALPSLLNLAPQLAFPPQLLRLLLQAHLSSDSDPTSLLHQPSLRTSTYSFPPSQLAILFLPPKCSSAYASTLRLRMPPFQAPLSLSCGLDRFKRGSAFIKRGTQDREAPSVGTEIDRRRGERRQKGVHECVIVSLYNGPV